MAIFLLNIKKEWSMNTGKTIFSQIMDILPMHDF